MRARARRAAVPLAALVALAALLPPWPSYAGIPPQSLVEVADFSGLVVSPDGRRLAFRVERASVEHDTYDSTWYVQDTDGRSPPRRVGDGGEPLRDEGGGALPAEARWSPDGRWLFYRALRDGGIQVWRAATDGTVGMPVTADAANVRAFALSGDGGKLRYSVGATREDIVHAEQEEYDHGVHVTPDVPIGQGLFRSHYVDGRLAMQRYDGIGFVREGLLASVPARWKEVDLATGKASDVRPDESPKGDGTIDAMRDPRTGRAISIVQSGTGSDGSDSALKVLPAPSGGPGIECRDEACSHAPITSAQWRPGANEVLFTTSARSEGWAQSIFRWNIDTGEVLPVMQSRGLVNGGRERSSTCAIAAEALACVVAEPDRPPRLERIDIETGRRQPMFEPNAALASDLEKAITPRFLRWKDAKGHEFTGQLFLGTADAASPRPLFVTYYSCPGFLRGGTGDEWPLASLAADGIATLCINAAPYVFDPVVRYDTGLEAVRSVVALLAGEGIVDPARVGMGGLSFGSEVTQWVATESDLLAAASEAAPSVTPLYYLISSLQGGRFFTGLYAAWGLRAPEATPAQWKRISPTFNLDRIHIPILYQMPEEEYLLALDYLIPMMREQKADLFIFPDETHQKFLPRHKAAAYERNLDWFRFWLQGYESADAEKRGQYEHWRAMRDALRGEGSR
jgi:dipeptidyl aminopeptidase/acylaminoacyl peptidase